MMAGRDRKRAPLRALDQLEPRWLLAAPQLPGNVGEIVASQYQPSGFTTKVGTQLKDVKLSGQIKIGVATPPPSGDASPGSSAYPVNAGLIGFSQFNGAGFRTVGLQMDKVTLGGGLTVSGFDNEPAGGLLANNGFFFRTAVNTNLVLNSQFNDGGFGVLDRLPDGRVIAREGRVGLQWSAVKVKGPVAIGLQDDIIRPGAIGSASPAASAVPAVSSVTPALGTFGQKVVDPTTNTGQISNSQFNDGGFGDIGIQWSKVAIGGHVGTSTNTLFINPLQNNYGPITVTNRVFGNTTAGASSQATATPAVNPVAQPAAPAQAATVQSAPFETTYSNSATNSGRISNSQFNDGGFGDIGMQWKNVRVKGSVSAVHNSLTVQPENAGQGLITVQGIQFPSVAPTLPQPAPSPAQPIPDAPAVVTDGVPLTTPLPAPTGPLSPFFPIPLNGPGILTLPNPGNFPLENAATTSGLIQGGQFNAGGFGDDGLQWNKVQVGGNVQVVHNSLSVHPEGSNLAGIAVSNVSYGAPVTKRVARSLAVLPYLVVSTGNDSAVGGVTVTGAVVKGGHILTPPNNRILTNQQVAAAGGTDVFLQWNGIEHKRGLVLVHNIIKITGVGPTTGPITLSNIRFPFKIPPTGPLVTVSAQPAAASSSAQSAAVSAGIEPRNAILLNSSNNSGIVKQAQFSSGGFGDDGLQWNNVSVSDSVTEVHNTLAVDTSADFPVLGPIAISNITFNSGVLDTVLSSKRDQILVSPPDIFQRASTHPASLGKALPEDPKVRNESINTGILKGGQLTAGGANHTLLQWQCVRVTGKVTVIDNVLSISVKDRPSGPITISNVTFA
jgi:hypothetical protein